MVHIPEMDEPRRVQTTENRGLSGLIPRRYELRALVDLAVPVVVVQVGMMMMGVVDSIMVGRVSPEHLAGVALGNLYFFSATVFGMGVLLALDPVISQSVGAADQEGVARAVQRGSLLALGLSLVAILLFLPARPLLVWLSQPEDVVPIAAEYALASIPGVFPFYLYMVLRQTLQSLGRVAPVVGAVVLGNLANAFFNWILVYGNLRAPALGAVGAAWATSLTRTLMTVGLLAVAWRVLRPFARPFRREILRPRPLGRMIRIGAPIGVQLQLEFGAFAVIGVCMGVIGTVAIASHQVALNLASLTFMVPLGVAQASSVLVGRAIGRGDSGAASRAAGAGLVIAAGFMSLTAIVLLSIPQLLAHAYSPDPEVVALAALLLPVAGVFQVFDGLQVVATAVLRGTGDTRLPMLLHVAGFWAVGLPVSLILGFRLGAGPVGLWGGLAAGLGVVAALLLIRVERRFSGDLSRLSVEDSQAPSQTASVGGGVELP
jgi:MATE family multidrug resistance protein